MNIIRKYLINGKLKSTEDHEEYFSIAKGVGETGINLVVSTDHGELHYPSHWPSALLPPPEIVDLIYESYPSGLLFREKIPVGRTVKHFARIFMRFPEVIETINKRKARLEEMFGRS